MRLLLFGNSGSGKSTLARRLAEECGLALLALDALVWEPGKIAVPRRAAHVQADLTAFLARHDRWVIEGCYGGLVATAAPHCTLLVLLNPGVAACQANCRRRPWEPDKYASAAEQDARLPMLLEWVAAYYTRNDDLSLAAHRRIFDGFPGPKRELTKLPEIAAYSLPIGLTSSVDEKGGRVSLRA